MRSTRSSRGVTEASTRRLPGSSFTWAARALLVVLYACFNQVIETKIELSSPIDRREPGKV
jgi:hypothetical protein